MIVLEKVRTNLQARGAKTIRSIGKMFHVMDNNGDRKVDKLEFYQGLMDLGANITKHEAEVLLDALDTNHDGVVDFNEFLIAMRGQPSAARQAVIDKAFNKFDLSGDGVITAADLATVFDCSQHPKVRAGEMTQEEVFVEFLSCFGDKNKDGTITRAEWNDYYGTVSASVDNDDHFIQLM